MTSKQIEEQIAAIRRATAKAMVSKEAATEFLISAGIIGKNDNSVNSANGLNGTGVTSNARAVIKSKKTHRKESHQD